MGQAFLHDSDPGIPGAGAGYPKIPTIHPRYPARYPARIPAPVRREARAGPPGAPRPVSGESHGRPPCPRAASLWAACARPCGPVRDGRRTSPAGACGRTGGRAVGGRAQTSIRGRIAGSRPAQSSIRGGPCESGRFPREAAGPDAESDAQPRRIRCANPRNPRRIRCASPQSPMPIHAEPYARPPRKPLPGQRNSPLHIIHITDSLRLHD